MKVLTVYAHPNPNSFTHALLEEFTRGLADAGHEADVLDLYAAGLDSAQILEELPDLEIEDLAAVGQYACKSADVHDLEA